MLPVCPKVKRLDTNSSPKGAKRRRITSVERLTLVIIDILWYTVCTQVARSIAMAPIRRPSLPQGTNPRREYSTDELFGEAVVGIAQAGTHGTGI